LLRGRPWSGNSLDDRFEGSKVLAVGINQENVFVFWDLWAAVTPAGPASSTRFMWTGSEFAPSSGTISEVSLFIRSGSRRFITHPLIHGLFPQATAARPSAKRRRSRRSGAALDLLAPFGAVYGMKPASSSGFGAPSFSASTTQPPPMAL
jgi:hypothetical protein